MVLAEPCAECSEKWRMNSAKPRGSLSCSCRRARAVAVGRGDLRHAFVAHGLGERARLLLELRVLVRMRAVAAAGHHQRQRPRANRPCRNAAWRNRPSTVRRHALARCRAPSSTQQDVVAAALLRIALDVRWHVRRRIAARVVGDAAVAAREMAHLRLPAAVVAGELVHEHDRRAGCRFPRSRASRRRRWSGSA